MNKSSQENSNCFLIYIHSIKTNSMYMYSIACVAEHVNNRKLSWNFLLKQIMGK